MMVKMKIWDVEISRHGKKEMLHTEARTREAAHEIVWRSNIDLLWSDIKVLGEHK